MLQDPPIAKSKLELPAALPASQLVDFTVHGQQPILATAPSTPEEMGNILKIAQQARLAVVPFGSGSKQSIGNPPRRFDLALSTHLLNDISEYFPQDLVVRVESGCTLAHLQKLLAADRLCLPIDPPCSNATTLGGIVATNSSGPSRFGYGTIRDYLLGICVIQADGTKTQFGSRVVKNVTGYDMCKLYAGSLGTLGVFSEFYLKLKPLPPVEKSVVVLFKNLQEIQQAMICLSRSPLLPVAFEFLNSDALQVLDQGLSWTGEISPYTLVVRFSDFDNAVDWQIKKLKELWKPYCAQVIILNDSYEQTVLSEFLREDYPYLAQPPLETVKLKINILPSQLVEWIKVLEEQFSKSMAPVFLKAHAGNGIIRVFYHLDSSTHGICYIAKLIQKWRAELTSVRGSVVIESAPAALKKKVDAWGYQYKDLNLMKKIKNSLDPTGLLNPGRFVV